MTHDYDIHIKTGPRDAPNPLRSWDEAAPRKPQAAAPAPAPALVLYCEIETEAGVAAELELAIGVELLDTAATGNQPEPHETSPQPDMIHTRNGFCRQAFPEVTSPATCDKFQGHHKPTHGAKQRKYAFEKNIPPMKQSLPQLV